MSGTGLAIGIILGGLLIFVLEEREMWKQWRQHRNADEQLRRLNSNNDGGRRENFPTRVKTATH